jgi:hypothetical protein
MKAFDTCACPFSMSIFSTASWICSIVGEVGSGRVCISTQRPGREPIRTLAITPANGDGGSVDGI